MPSGIGFFISAVSYLQYLIGNIYDTGPTIILLILMHIVLLKT